jgi:hypothetical protein
LTPFVKSASAKVEFVLQIAFTNFSHERHLIVAISPHSSGIVQCHRNGAKPALAAGEVPKLTRAELCAKTC